MEMVTVSKGTSTRIPLSTQYTSVIVVAGRGLLQGIQVINTKDTALVERVEGVSEPEVIKKHELILLLNLSLRSAWRVLMMAVIPS